jgi:hypothetical protein
MQDPSAQRNALPAELLNQKTIKRTMQDPSAQRNALPAELLNQKIIKKNYSGLTMKLITDQFINLRWQMYDIFIKFAKHNFFFQSQLPS